MNFPNLHALTGGRYEAMCGRCMRPSLAMAAHDPEGAWAALQGRGWTLYTPQGMARGYALCPSCTANPTTVLEMAIPVPRS